MNGLDELRKLDRNLQGLIHQMGSANANAEVRYFAQQIARLKLLPLLKQLRYAMNDLEPAMAPAGVKADVPRPPKSKKPVEPEKFNAEDFLDEPVS